jgi:pyruvate kinase
VPQVVAPGPLVLADVALGGQRSQKPMYRVEEMDRICRAAEEEINYGRDIVAYTDWGRGDRYDALTHAACELAEDLDLDAIITSTQSGLSCIRVARLRPPKKILAVSPEEPTVRMLALVWGVRAVCGEQRGNIEERYDEAIEAARKAGVRPRGRAGHPHGGLDGGHAGLDEHAQVAHGRRRRVTFPVRSLPFEGNRRKRHREIRRSL